MTKVCRLCLVNLQRGSKYFNINAVEALTGFMPYRDQLTTCIPELALDMIPNPVICNSCRSALRFAYDFKRRCMQVEEKLREFVEKQPSDAIDLSKLSAEEAVEKVKIEINPLEIEITPSMGSSQSEPSPLEPEVPEVKMEHVSDEEKEEEKPAEPPEKKEATSFCCFVCNINFPNQRALVLHQSMHGEMDYKCNFCSRTFKNLRSLRKHNSTCMTGEQPVLKSILTKRPHLPAKAKNHLKRWLFRHTEHPYPTDLEKQTLMQETNLTLLQVENWFINARRRILQDLTRMKQANNCEEYLDFQSDSEIDAALELNSFEPKVFLSPSVQLFKAKRGRRKHSSQNQNQSSSEQNVTNSVFQYE